MHRLMNDGMPWRTTRLLGCPCVLLTGVLLAGCSSIGAKPYQRGVLAKPAMQLDHHALSRSFDDHIYFSKEASSGGAGFGGGGCGCN
jgi:hypothetical protein